MNTYHIMMKLYQNSYITYIPVNDSEFGLSQQDQLLLDNGQHAQLHSHYTTLHGQSTRTKS